MRCWRRSEPLRRRRASPRICIMWFGVGCHMNKKALMFAGIGLFALAVAGDQGVLLRRELKENATETYKLETEVKQNADVPGIGDQDLHLTSTMTVTLKSGKLDAAAGQVPIDATLAVAQVKADGSIADMFGN